MRMGEENEVQRPHSIIIKVRQIHPAPYVEGMVPHPAGIDHEGAPVRRGDEGSVPLMNVNEMNDHFRRSGKLPEP